MNPGGKRGGKATAPAGSTVQAPSAGRVANVQRIARARANRGLADQRRSTADLRMYSENKARKALAFYTGRYKSSASAMKTGAEVRAKMLASLRRAKGLPAGQSGYREPKVRLTAAKASR